MGKGLTNPLELDRETIYKIKWLKKKNTRGISIEQEGKNLPREIKIMLVNSLLRDLSIDIEVGRNA